MKSSFRNNFQRKIYEIIFKSNTLAGKWFDIILLVLIAASLMAIILESVASIENKFGFYLVAIEWTCTILFTFEYIARLYSNPRPARYAFSFFGIIDFLSVLPTWLELYFTEIHFLMIIRSFRLLRMFRIFRLTSYLRESQILLDALSASKRKITVFLATVLTIVMVIGTIIYQIEGEENGFTSIPRSMYWAVVTLTTVGYGDMSPKTALGQFIASAVMVLGYSIIAIPTGIVSSEIAMAIHKKNEDRKCSFCSQKGHDPDAIYCYNCGKKFFN